MKLRLSIHRKNGTANFGSDGAGAELELELPDDESPDGVRACVRAHYSILEGAVAEELARLAARPIAPVVQVRDEGRRGDARDDRDDDRRDDRPRGPRPNGRPPGRGGGSAGGGGDRPPKTGRELIAWAGDRDLKGRVYELGKAWELPGKVLDWHADDVRSVYDELSREASRPAGRNGYSGARA